MKKICASLLILLALGSSFQVMAGSGKCQHDSDTASDGSRCGERSADSREGGK